MRGWPVKNLGDILTIERGGSPRPIDSFITESKDGINWIKIGDTKGVTKYITETKERIKPEGVKRSRMVYEGDFILSNSMSFGHPYIMKTTGCIHDGWLVLRPNDTSIYPDFLYYLLGSPIVSSQFDSLATGTTVRNLNVDLVKSVSIPLPPLPEQERIVALLDEADELRKLRGQADKRSKEIIPALFEEMFGASNAESTKWPILPLHLIVGSSDDIKCGPFGTQLKRDEFKSTGVPLLGIKHVNSNFILPTIEFLSEEKAYELSQYSIKAGDLVMTRKGTVGNCAIYPSNYPLGIMHSDLLRIRVDSEKCNSVFLSAQLHYASGLSRQIENISHGAIMAGVNVGKLKNLKVVVPPMELQTEFATRVTSLRALASSQSSSRENLDALFQSMLHRAFRGEL